MDNVNHSLNLIEILKKGYRQDKNGKWVHKGKYGYPKEYIELLIKNYIENI